jgi:hypothetical protein
VVFGGSAGDHNIILLLLLGLGTWLSHVGNLEPINHITPKLARVKLEAMGFMRAQKYTNLQKNPLKKTPQNPSRYYYNSIITNLKL